MVKNTNKTTLLRYT